MEIELENKKLKQQLVVARKQGLPKDRGPGYDSYEFIGVMAPGTGAQLSLSPNTLTSSGSSSWALPVNPSLQYCPLNAARSLTFSRWRHKGDFRARFTPTAGAYGSVSGDVIAAWNPEATDPMSFSLITLLDYTHSKQERNDKKFEFIIPYKDLPKQWFFTRIGDTGTNEDARLYDSGVLFLGNYNYATNTSPAPTVVGTWDIKFDVEFTDQVNSLSTNFTLPQYIDVLSYYLNAGSYTASQNIYIALTTGALASMVMNPIYLAKDGTVPANQLLGQFDYNNIGFNADGSYTVPPGQYCVEFFVTTNGPTVSTYQVMNFNVAATQGSTSLATETLSLTQLNGGSTSLQTWHLRSIVTVPYSNYAPVTTSVSGLPMGSLNARLVPSICFVSGFTTPQLQGTQPTVAGSPPTTTVNLLTRTTLYRLA